MDDPPIVVFVHAEPGRMFDDTGRPSAATSGDQSSPHARLGVSVDPRGGGYQLPEAPPPPDEPPPPLNPPPLLDDAVGTV